MKIGEVLKKHERTKALLILEKILNVNKEWIYIHTQEQLTEQQLADYDKIVYLNQTIPLQYILGYAYFYRQKYHVTKDCLIPRPETELLVEKALECSSRRTLDLCTGSGCIAIAYYLEKRDCGCEVWASDISVSALEVARKNAHDLKADIFFNQGDLFEGLQGKFDLIVSNPPYISQQDMEKLDVYVKKEPQIALSGGFDGLDFYRKIVLEAKRFLNPNGIILFEIGEEQSDALVEIFIKNKYINISVFKDYNDRDRIVKAQYNQLRGGR